MLVSGFVDYGHFSYPMQEEKRFDTEQLQIIDYCAVDIAITQRKDERRFVAFDFLARLVDPDWHDPPRCRGRVWPMPKVKFEMKASRVDFRRVCNFENRLETDT